MTLALPRWVGKQCSILANGSGAISMPKSLPTGRSRECRRVHSSIWDYRPFVGDEHRHMRTFDVRRAAGAAASRGADNITGHTGEIATNKRRTRSEFP